MHQFLASEEWEGRTNSANFRQKKLNSREVLLETPSDKIFQTISNSILKTVRLIEQTTNNSKTRHHQNETIEYDVNLALRDNIMSFCQQNKEILLSFALLMYVYITKTSSQLPPYPITFNQPVTGVKRQNVYNIQKHKLVFPGRERPFAMRSSSTVVVRWAKPKGKQNRKAFRRGNHVFSSNLAL